MQLSSRRERRGLRTAALLIVAATGGPGDATSPQHAGDSYPYGIDAIAPVTLVASRFADLSGVAAEPSGAVVVTDRVAGTLTRIHSSGQSELVLRDLRRPQGVVTTSRGDVIVLESGAGRILQLRVDGILSVVAEGLNQPTALAIGPDGAVWAAVQGHAGDSVTRIASDGHVTEVLEGLPAVRALAVTTSALLIATGTSVERVSLHANRPAGSAASIVRRWHATALVVDQLGAVYVGGWPVGAGGAAQAGIVKHDAGSGKTTRVASGVRQPAALALEAAGHLLTAEGSPHGRLWRFAAPPAPAITVPEFTNQAYIVVAGTAERGSRVHVFADGVVQALASADELSGQFSATTRLLSNSATELAFVAVAAGGAGLAGLPVRRLITHDDRPPQVTLTSPAAAAYVRDAARAAAHAVDEGPRMASLRFFVDDIDVGGAYAAGGASRVSAQTVIDFTRTAEGMHTLTAAAADRAGNQASAAQLVVIDRTPPETMLIGHPAREITEHAATFAFAAVDVLSPGLEFSWRLDGAEWSPYQAGASATVHGLEAGRHLFEVRARDLAGNQDPTPARWEFQVRAVFVDVVEPRAGSIVTTSTVWVRGAAGGAAPVTVSIALPAELQALVGAIHVPVVAGRFAAEIPVVPGQAAITVTVTDATGAFATQNLDVAVQDTMAPAARVAAVPSAGFAPHTVEFGTASLPVGMYTIDLDGDGTIEYSGDRPDEIRFSYAMTGAFLATIAAVTPDGLTLEWRSAVAVYDRGALEMELQAAWGGLKEALRLGEAGAAAAFVHTARRAMWGGYFAEHAVAIAAEVDAIFTDIELLGFEGDRLECEMMRAVDGLMFSFPVTFALDSDGRWRLWQF